MPAELELALICERWQALPNPGGVLDQPLGLLQRMSTALSVYRAIQSEANRGEMSLVEWSKHYPDTWRVLVSIEKLRMSQHGS